MPPVYRDSNVSARCPDCDGALSTFSYKKDGGGEHGIVIRNARHTFAEKQFSRYLYRLMSCGGCGRGGLAVVHDNGQVVGGILSEFFPVSIEQAPLPAGVPDGIKTEFREAETCAAHGALRAAGAMLRSTLDKTLQLIGYDEGDLYHNIEEAAEDNILHPVRRLRAHEAIRVLGNDVLHDPWRLVTEQEYEDAHKYTQRILEDLYDHWPTIEAQLATLREQKAKPITAPKA